MFDLKDKIALVTGANRGIGEAYVLHLLQAGAKTIYAAARDLDNLTPLLARNPQVIKPVLLDVTNAEHIKALATQIPALDILINNAGIANACSLSADNALQIAHTEMETNYFGPLQLTQALLALLKKSPLAAVINVSSIAGISSFPMMGPYSASKAALHSFTQGLRIELAADKIQVLGVYPGPIDTRMTEAFEMDKPKPSQVAERSFMALDNGELDVMPDDFSAQMYAAFLNHPHELEKAFAQMQ
ncbi:MAG: SDR family NAD(P)-dependent oxidoreductase [Gammaproteobacteria bacterium]|nr:SDR family NAD(P)-dependent oxidoreductase [Gammaproteobacteria bacterium]